MVVSFGRVSEADGCACRLLRRGGRRTHIRRVQNHDNASTEKAHVAHAGRACAASATRRVRRRVDWNHALCGRRPRSAVGARVEKGASEVRAKGGYLSPRLWRTSSRALHGGCEAAGCSRCWVAGGTGGVVVVRQRCARDELQAGDDVKPRCVYMLEYDRVYADWVRAILILTFRGAAARISLNVHINPTIPLQ